MRTPLRLVGLIGLLAATARASLPYNPTSILLPPNSTSAYLFLADQGQTQLYTLDYSSGLSTDTQKQGLGVAKELPSILSGGTDVAYTPILDTGGIITVVAGDCTKGVDGTQVWKYAAPGVAVNGARSWSQYQTTVKNMGGQAASSGSNYLAGGMAYSEYLQANASNTHIYAFGGMCPFANSSDATWTSNAQYSNQMLQLDPVSTAGYTDYDVSLATSDGPPIAEAGFSITPLPASYSETTGTQQQDFVLLGGHTKTAFLNMSQVAVFALPQETWAFLPVSQPSSAKTDLAAREAQTQTSVEPRSGHSAVLSEDGTSIVIFGGWVGDVDTPAEPQLAVLNLGSAYGGGGAWSWSVPGSSTGPGLASGAGIYGHGAAMLPGNVMMVAGGFSIAASPSKRAKRNSQAPSAQMYFYNVSSNSWLSAYEPPPDVVAQTSTNKGALSHKSKKAGLGAGLGIGAAILIGLVVFYFCYNSRLKRTQLQRGRGLLSRSSEDSFGPLSQPMTASGGIDGHDGDAAAVGRFWNVWDQSSNPQRTWAPQMQQTSAAGATGLFVDAPSPTRGLRKGAPHRGYQYHAAPRFEDKRMSRNSAYIPPIAEHEDEDAHSAELGADGRKDMLSDAERKLLEVERVLTSTDPFLEGDPNPLRSHPVSPEMLTQSTLVPAPLSVRTSVAGRADTPGWTDSTVVDESDRNSPAKFDDRTFSNLSERSHNSITRTMSTRTGAILAAAIAARSSSNSSPEHSWSSGNESRTQTMSTGGGRKSPFYYVNHTRTRSSTNDTYVNLPPSAGTDADLFMTSRSGFAQLQSEGEALLSGRPMMDRDDPYQRALGVVSKQPTYDDSFGALPPPVPPRRRQGWMGSLRRAINAVSERSFSLTGASVEHYADGPTTPIREIPPPATKPQRTGTTPRRATSDGGMLLMRKRGQKDWANDPNRYRDDPDPGDWGDIPDALVEREGGEEEWDVEGEASKRDVQVMFTVPKVRLRVVNADVEDRASLRSVSEGARAVESSVSLSELRKEVSRGMLRKMGADKAEEGKEGQDEAKLIDVDAMSGGDVEGAKEKAA